MVSLRALLKMELEDGYSNLVLDGALKAAKLERRDEALASALFYGVLERRLTLDAVIAAHSKIKIKKMSPQVRNILRLGVYQLLFSDKIPPFCGGGRIGKAHQSLPPGVCLRLCQRRAAGGAAGHGRSVSCERGRAGTAPVLSLFLPPVAGSAVAKALWRSRHGRYAPGVFASVAGVRPGEYHPGHRGGAFDAF